MKTLILGGARSGKSGLALAMASEAETGGQQVCFVATAEPGDAEMAERIRRHRNERPAHWSLVEEPLDLARAIIDNAGASRCVVVDCLTLWLGNVLMHHEGGELIPRREALLAAVDQVPGSLLMVSNETGLGVVPMGALSRRFCDEAGWLHQALARRCDRVALTVAGLPLWLKGAA